MIHIDSLEVVALEVPINKPMKTRYRTLEKSYCLLLTLRDSSGIEGQGLIRAANLGHVKMIEICLQQFFASQLLAQEFVKPEEVWHTLWLHRRNHLQSSFPLYALAAIDIAVWDIFAKQQQQTLHELFETEQKFVRPYGNGGWLSDSFQEMHEDVVWYLERGCQRFKMRIGGENDLPRVKYLRNTFGKELELSVDANQYYSLNDALEMSYRLADYDIKWFEEPLFSNSIVELARLAKLSPVPIATGENMNSHWQVQDVCQLSAAKIIQPDVIYQGGITEFKRSAENINSAGLVLGAHLFHELSCSLSGLCKEYYVEHLDFFPSDLFVHDFSIHNGKIMLPQMPGHGAIIAQQAIEKYRVSL